VSQRQKSKIGQMQTPGAENAMLKNRVTGCTCDKRSVAGKCHFFRVSLRVSDNEDARASDLRLYMWRDRKNYPVFICPGSAMTCLTDHF
jgi:hypothetical protein